MRRVMIAGGGVGGLSAGIALQRAGLQVKIFEQADKISPLGGSLSLFSNAIACLRKLGVADQMVAQGSVINSIQMRAKSSGKILANAPLNALHSELGEVSVCITRSVLQSILLREFGESNFNLDAKLYAFEHAADGVRAFFTNGRVETADILIGADGLNSATRQQLFNDGPPRYSGYGAWLCVADFPHKKIPSDVVSETWGRGERFGVVPSGRDKVAWFFIENRAVPYPAGLNGGKIELLDKLCSWPSLMQELVDASEDENIVRVSFFDRPVCEKWGANRVLLLGDAIHPFVPNLGQGACQAIEDAVALGEAVTHNLDFADIQTAYECARLSRATMISRQASRISIYAQTENLLFCWLRDRFVSLIPTSLHIRQARQYMTL